MSWVDRGRDAGRSSREIDVKDLQEQLDSVRDHLRDLTASFTQGGQSPMGPRARARPRHGQEAEDLMKENLVASLVVALGLGILVGYLIRRGAE
jgi:hypothetical protein